MLKEIRKKELSLEKGGKKLKEVGKRARRDIEMLLGSKVYLELWVKVQKETGETKLTLFAKLVMLKTKINLKSGEDNCYAPKRDYHQSS